MMLIRRTLGTRLGAATRALGFGRSDNARTQAPRALGPAELTKFRNDPV